MICSLVITIVLLNKIPCYYSERGLCTFTAYGMLEAMDATQDPCEDFYEYANGGWIRDHPLSDKMSSWSRFSEIHAKNQQSIKNDLENVDLTKPWGAEAKARVYYDACLDRNGTIEKLGPKPVLDVVRHLRGWSSLNGTIDRHWSWDFQEMTQLVQNTYNVEALFTAAVKEDDYNSSRYTIVLDQVNLYLPRLVYLNKTALNKELEDYQDHMTRTFILLGADKSEARMKTNRVIEFETKLANITTPSEARRNIKALYNSYTISEWQDVATFLDWSMFFNNAFKAVNITVLNTDRIVVYAPEYFRKLTKVLNEYIETKVGQRALISYMEWQVVRSLSAYLSKPFRDAGSNISQKTQSTSDKKKSWRYCIYDTNNVFGFAFGAMFVRKNFNDEAKNELKEMFENIRHTNKLLIKKSDWLEPETAQAAELKNDAITAMFGYPPYIRNKEELDKQYEDLVVKPDECFNNKIASIEFRVNTELKKLKEPVDKTKWSFTPSTVNGMYYVRRNQIVVPAGILQKPVFDVDYPKSIIYGAMGSFLGHEMSHALDDQGREYDRFGNLHQWWNNATTEQFKKHAACFEKQYSSYAVDGKHLNGKRTLGENIADNAGVKAAYHAYIDLTNRVKLHRTVPGFRMLNYNDKKLFFISYAQAWSTAISKESMKRQIENDDHTVAKLRVNIALSNMEEFSEAFQCPLGSNMNPVQKCTLW